MALAGRVAPGSEPPPGHERRQRPKHEQQGSRQLQSILEGIDAYCLRQWGSVVERSNRAFQVRNRTFLVKRAVGAAAPRRHELGGCGKPTGDLVDRPGWRDLGLRRLRGSERLRGLLRFR